jgi:hypothetical protein
MPEGPKLSQDELVRILQKAAEREAREGPRSFTAAEAIQAGRELGLSAGSVQAELERLALRKAEHEGALRQRPFDSRITVQCDPDRFLLQVPPRGPHASALGLLGFSGFFLAFISYWTYGAVTMGAPLAFTAFSAPFWLVGAGMLGGAVRSMIGTEQLELGRSEGVLTSRPFGRTRRLRTSELRVRLDRVRQRRGQNGPETEVPALALDHGTRTYHLLTHFSPAEQSWVKAELDHWLAE